MSNAKVKQAPAARTAKAPAAKAASVAPAAKAAPVAPEVVVPALAVETAVAEMVAAPAAAPEAPAPEAPAVIKVEQVAKATQDFAAKAPAPALRTYEDSLRATKESVDEALKSGATFARGLQDIGKAVLGLTQASIEEGVSASKKIIAAKTMHEMVEAQTDLAKSNLDRMMAEGARLSEMTAQLYREALAPIAARVTASVDKLVKTAK